MLAISIAVGCRNCVEMAFLSFFSFLGITSELFDEFAYWFLHYQPSFYYCTAILLSILFHSILFPCIWFQILFLWILFLMWAIYRDIIDFIIFQCTFTWMFYASLFRAIVYMYICMFIYLSIYWKSGTSDLMVLMLFVLQCTDYKSNFLTLTLTLMYAMHKRGLTNTHWQVVKNLNQNLKAQLLTKHGLTEEFDIRDSIRQGGVLSVIQYALLMDEISKEINEEKREKNWKESKKLQVAYYGWTTYNSYQRTPMNYRTCWT